MILFPLIFSYSITTSLLSFSSGPSYILFLHVPLAWLSLLTILFINLFSLIYLLYNRITFLHYSLALITLSIFFCSLTIFTGILWSKPTWGDYIVLDSRLLFMILLLIISLSYRGLSQFQHHFLYAIVSSFGFLYVIFIKYSVIWWSSLHQINSITLTSFKIDKFLLIPLLLVFLSFSIWAFYLFLLELRTLRYNLLHSTHIIS